MINIFMDHPIPLETWYCFTTSEFPEEQAESFTNLGVDPTKSWPRYWTKITESKICKTTIKRAVVHFNRLKRCPPNTRFSSDKNNNPSRQSPSMPDQRPPVGSNIELLDHPDLHITQDNQSQQRRYPSRECHPPDKLAMYFSH